MKLQAKVHSISKESVVEECSLLLDRSKPFVSCLGGRFIHVQGYEGSVRIDEIAKKFLAAISDIRESKPPLEYRLKALEVWKRIERLYANTDRTRNRILIHSRSQPRAAFWGFHYFHERDRILHFLPHEYHRLFPGKRIIRRVVAFNPELGTKKEYYMASEEFLKASVKNRSRL